MVGEQRKRVGAASEHERKRWHSGRFAVDAGGLVTDLCFSWEGDARCIEVVLVTVNGTIAGAFPVRVARGERLPVHRRFVPQSGDARWFLRLTSGDAAVAGLKVEVEVRDPRGRSVAAPLCEALSLSPGRVVTVENMVAVPEQLLA